MRRAWFYLLPLFLLVLIFPLAAQEEDPDSEPEFEIPEIDWEVYIPDLYRAGDGIINITAGPIIPTIFTGEGMGDNESSGIKIGGMGSFAYSYFLNPNWFIGGELRGMFAGTRGKNMLYIVTIGPFAGYQITKGRFEFPLRLMTGIAMQNYNIGEGYLGLIVNPGVSAFYRYNPDWSFGVNLQWWMLPQWPKAEGKFVLGNFLEVSLTARYHF